MKDILQPFVIRPIAEGMLLPESSCIGPEEILGGVGREMLCDVVQQPGFGIPGCVKLWTVREDVSFGVKVVVLVSIFFSEALERWDVERGGEFGVNLNREVAAEGLNYGSVCRGGEEDYGSRYLGEKEREPIKIFVMGVFGGFERVESGD